MKNKIFLLMAALAVFSCDDFLDINTNPNSPASSTPELVLPNALNATAAQTFYNQMGAMWAGQWAPSGDVSGFVQEKTYDFNNTYGTQVWTGMYDILLDYKYIMDAGAAIGKKGSPAIAKIMSTYLYHKLVDTYGNIPYTDALQGTAVIRPTYDNAQAVYEAIIDDLDEAIADIKSISDPADNPGTADIVFKGNYTKWIQFANTLKLRLLIRQSAMSGRSSYINAEIAQISSEGFLTEDANSTPGYLKTSGKLNPFWSTYYKNENDQVSNNFNFYRSSRFLVDNLPVNDPRRFYIVAPAGSNVQSVSSSTSRVGVTYGDESSSAYSNVTSGIGFGILKSYDMPMTLITAAESYFLQAEAVTLGYLTGDAKTLWQSGILSSFKLLGVVPASADVNTEPFKTYYAGIESGYDGVQSIITQKWVASVGYGGFEAWADYRRTGYPNVPLSLRAIKNSIPVRLYYPSTELQTNAQNVAAQGTIDALTTKIFWDVN